jgi:hypothetical protein
MWLASKSLFLTFTHKFINPNICIKNFKMATIITQEEGPTINHQTRDLTMAILPNVGEKKFLQQSFCFGKLNQLKLSVPQKATRKVEVPEHMRGTSRVAKHNRKVKVEGDGNKMNAKSAKSKKKTRPKNIVSLPI